MLSRSGILFTHRYDKSDFFFVSLQCYDLNAKKNPYQNEISLLSSTVDLTRGMSVCVLVLIH